jgi:hypothetical protein
LKAGLILMALEGRQDHPWTRRRTRERKENNAGPFARRRRKNLPDRMCQHEERTADRLLLTCSERHSKTYRQLRNMRRLLRGRSTRITGERAEEFGRRGAGQAANATTLTLVPPGSLSQSHRRSDVCALTIRPELGNPCKRRLPPLTSPLSSVHGTQSLGRLHQRNQDKRKTMRGSEPGMAVAVRACGSEYDRRPHSGEQRTGNGRGNSYGWRRRAAERWRSNT